MEEIELTIDGQTMRIPGDDPRIPQIKEKIRGMSPEERTTLNFRVIQPEPASRDQARAQRQGRGTAQEREARGRGIVDATARNVRQFGGDLARGTERIVTGDVSLQEAGDALETSIRSGTAPLGGDFLAAGGENITRFLTGQENNPNALREQRARREELAAEAPLQAGASEALGFGGLFKALTGAIPALRVAQGSTIANPNRLRNTAATAGEAFTTTVAGEKAMGTDTTQALQQGGIAAVAAPAMTGLLRAMTQGAQGVPSGITSAQADDALRTAAEPAAIRSLFQRLEMDPEEGLQRLAAARARGNPTPTIADLMNEREIDNIKNLATGRRAAADTLDAEETVAARRRADEMRTRITEGAQGGQVRTQAVEALETNANDRLTTALRSDQGAGRLADTPIDKNPFQDLFMDDAGEALRSSLSTNLRRQLADVLDGDEDMTIDLAEQVRQAFSKRGGAGENYRFVEASQSVRDIIRAESGEYATAFDRFKEDFSFIDGFKRGQRAVGRDSAELTDVFQSLDPAEQEGVRAGVRMRLASTAGRRPGTAVRVADELADSQDMRSILELTEGAQEADNLVALGEQARQSANNMTRLSPATQLPPALRDASEQLAEAAAAVGGRGSGILFARLAGNVVGNLRAIGVPPNAAQKMAQLITDPAQSERVLQRLVEVGIDERELTQLVQGIVSTLKSGPTEGARETLLPESRDER
jgi:hypothetical protein